METSFANGGQISDRRRAEHLPGGGLLGFAHRRRWIQAGVLAPRRACASRAPPSSRATAPSWTRCAAARCYGAPRSSSRARATW